MKKVAFLLIFVFSVLSAAASSAQMPHQIGPFVLNQPISNFEKFVDMFSSMPVRYMEYVKEVEIKPIKGFKSGLIAYGACEKPSRIVRIKLKYTDDSQQFFDNLIKRIEQRYGKRDEYRGDPFRVVVAWKWSFVDPDGNKISLIVQHNTQDEEEKMGNSIKMTLTSKLEEYQRCYEEKRAQMKEGPDQPQEKLEVPGLEGWELFLPR
jgi:hypothetical protein